jgi:succinyl-diaminopimelate desuccinylase
MTPAGAQVALSNSDAIRSIVALAQSLIEIPSQGGIDDPGTICGFLAMWLDAHQLPARILRDDGGRPVAVLVELQRRPGPIYCLNACLDTAPVGDVRAWTRNPLGGEIVDGWLYGRGSADCKTAVSVFAHVGLDARQSGRFEGTLALLFDADEHTGRFGGIKTYVAEAPKVQGVMIGYPGNYGIVVGARGFYRLQVEVFGTSDHSGSTRSHPENAIVKAMKVVQRLSHVSLPEERDSDFRFGPKVTVTQIHGGHGFSVVPDSCMIGVDMRLTPSFGAEQALRLISEICCEIDKELPSRLATVILPEVSWPAYRLPNNSRVGRALRDGAEEVFGRSLPWVVAGPSNIGNYLASQGIEATCGFGASYKHLHAPDESIDISTLIPVFQAYRRAVARLVTRRHEHD